MIDALAKAWEAISLTQLAVVGYIAIGFVVAFAILISRRSRYTRDLSGRSRDTVNSALWWVFVFLPLYGAIGFVVKILLWPIWFAWLIIEEHEDHLTKR